MLKNLNTPGPIVSSVLRDEEEVDRRLTVRNND